MADHVVDLGLAGVDADGFDPLLRLLEQSQAIALAPPAPREVRLDASELSNDSTLSWAASSDPNVAGYRVVWRSTDSTTWQRAKDVGTATRVTLPQLSKDNVIFGVQALSAGGHASLASYPLPLLRN
jgi:hypothetical protein